MSEQEKNKIEVYSSIKDLALDGAELQMDLTEDAWSYGAPVPAGVYDFKWFLAKEAFTVGYEKPGDPRSMYIRMSIEGKLINDSELEDSMVYAYLDSRIFRGKNISTMAGFIVKAGYKIPMPITVKKLAAMAEAILKKEPTIKAEVDWKASYKYTNKKGEEVYKNLYNKFEDFPKDDKGVRKFEFNVTGDDGLPHDVRAQVKINRYFAKGEELPTKKLVSAPRGVVAQQVASEPELDITPNVVIAKGGGASKAEPVNTDDADMELLLA